MVENIQNCAGCTDYCVEYTRKSTTTTDVPIEIIQGRMCVLNNLERETGNTESGASTLICLIESFNISFILSPVPFPRAMMSISLIVLNDQRKEYVFRKKLASNND